MAGKIVSAADVKKQRPGAHRMGDAPGLAGRLGCFESDRQRDDAPIGAPCPVHSAQRGVRLAEHPADENGNARPPLMCGGVI